MLYRSANGPGVRRTAQSVKALSSKNEEGTRMATQREKVLRGGEGRKLRQSKGGEKGWVDADKEEGCKARGWYPAPSEKELVVAWIPFWEMQWAKEKKEVRLKQAKKEEGEKDEEGSSANGWRYEMHLYEEWLWQSIRTKRYLFLSVKMIYALIRLKEQLWRRHRMFYDVETIQEVYPENELAEWVWEAFKKGEEPKIKWRDGEMAYEWTNEWCGRYPPKRMRSYEKEVEIQARRRKYRERLLV